jgi:group I intron endonuclease
MGFIYKITNIISKKYYIGETKKSNPYLRWNEHKRKIEKGIGCPALQDAVKKYGIKNFKFEILIICFDEDRYRFEMEYIKKYNSISPYGYNLTNGGEGGGFFGKKHSPETIERIRQTLKQTYIDNPELKQKISERQTTLMSSVEACNKIKNGLNNSEKLKLAKENKKIGNCDNRKPTEETKNKIKESVKHYFNKNNNEDTKINIMKHRDIMAKSSGVKIAQYDSKNILLNTFNSIREASRITGIPRSTIMVNLSKDKTTDGISWKKL